MHQRRHRYRCGRNHGRRSNPTSDSGVLIEAIGEYSLSLAVLGLFTLVAGITAMFGVENAQSTA